MAVLVKSFHEKMLNTLLDAAGKEIMVSLHSGRKIDQRGKKMIGVPKITTWGESVTFSFPTKDQYISWFGVWTRDGVLVMYNRPDWRNSSIILPAGSTLTVTPNITLSVISP